MKVKFRSSKRKMGDMEASEGIWGRYRQYIPVTVAERSRAWSCLRSRGRRDRGFESHAGHVCLLFVLSTLFGLCTCRGIATSWSPVQGVLLTVLNLVTEVQREVSWRRPYLNWAVEPKERKQ
jgi:hypothetical protein